MLSHLFYPCLGADSLRVAVCNLPRYDFITHGAPTVHAFGFGRGGLSEIVKQLDDTRRRLAG